MKTSVTLVRKEEQTVGTWAGGTTTQLAIWPPEADYKLRNFMWRISTARVDLEESVFTSLPGFHRLLMILEGSVRLTHEEHHEADLSAFEQDSFEGGWSTTSRGRCVDFNLMTAQESEGKIQALRNISEELCVALFDFHPTPDRSVLLTEAFYCLQDGLEAWLSEGEETRKMQLNRGDLLMLQIESTLRKEKAELRFKGIDEKNVWSIRASIASRAVV